MKYLLENRERKTLLLTFLFLFTTGLVVGQDANLPEPMNPPRIVNDYVGVLSNGEYQTLEHKLQSYEDSTSSQLAVVIVDSTKPYDIAQFGAELGEKWGVGVEGKDNGLIITVAIEDRQVYISTGYGMEGVVPDATARHIIQDFITPNFRNGDYYTGLDEATTVIMKLASGEFTQDQIAKGRQNDGRRSKGIASLILPFIIIMLISFSRYRRFSKNHYGGNAGFWTIMALMMSGGGRGRSGSGWNDFNSGGGGFGGFGGGSFGGGGAGGSW